VKGQEKTTAAVVVPKNSEPFDAALLALHDLLITSIRILNCKLLRIVWCMVAHAI
jgi:hypothetical protein